MSKALLPGDRVRIKITHEWEDLVPERREITVIQFSEEDGYTFITAADGTTYQDVPYKLLDRPWLPWYGSIRLAARLDPNWVQRAAELSQQLGQLRPGQRVYDWTKLPRVVILEPSAWANSWAITSEDPFSDIADRLIRPKDIVAARLISLDVEYARVLLRRAWKRRNTFPDWVYSEWGWNSSSAIEKLEFWYNQQMLHGDWGAGDDNLAYERLIRGEDEQGNPKSWSHPDDDEDSATAN